MPLRMKDVWLRILRLIFFATLDPCGALAPINRLSIHHQRILTGSDLELGYSERLALNILDDALAVRARA